MIRVSELTGAQLDYWTARAEGIPAEQLAIRRVQRSTDFHCIETRGTGAWVLNYSTDWAQGGPLFFKYRIEFRDIEDDGFYAGFGEECIDGDWDWKFAGSGRDHLVAACRAVVRAAFGDEVEEVGVC